MRNQNFITSPKGGNRTVKSNDLVTVIILGENHGYRMKAYGPLPLIQIHKQSLIERQINAIKSTFMNFEIILCAGFEATKTVTFIKTKFPNINIRVVENQIHFNSNCCESTRLCINNTSNDKVVICGGGVLLSAPQLEMIDIKQSAVVIQSQPDDSNFEVGVISNDNYLERLSVGVKHKYWTEIIYLSDKKTVEAFSTILDNPDYKNRFVFEAINDLSEKTRLMIQDNTTNKPIIKIDNIKTLRRIMKI